MNRLTTNIKRSVLLTLCALVIVALPITAMACTSSERPSNQKTTTTTVTPANPDNNQSTASDEDGKDYDYSGFEILSTKENDGKIELETTLGKLSYPSAFSDVITVKAEGGKSSAKLSFYAKLSTGEALIYSIIYGGDEGTPCGALSVGNDTKTVIVHVTFAEAPDNITDGDEATFYATQETFNDAIASMEADERFVGLG